MVYVFHVDGYEDTEMIAPLDMLSRANIPMTRVGVTGKTITGKMGFTIEADILPEELDLSDCEMIFLPGGPGTHNYFDKPVIDKAIAYCMEHHCYMAAICAAPSVLAAKGALDGKKAVCHFSVEDQMGNAQLQKGLVCVDDNVVTGCGAAASIELGLTMVELLRGKEAADQVRHGIGICE
ncbi:MAG: DJ-1/PfpI family protein [Eubacteriales bacterium]|nr:DJ-1/PfpI family protein [Eubacteriales bacterium]